MFAPVCATGRIAFERRVVRDRATAQVAGQVLQQLLGTTGFAIRLPRWRLDVADPFGRLQLTQQGFPRLVGLQVLEVALQPQLVLCAKPTQTGEKMPAIGATQRHRVDQIVVRRMAAVAALTVHPAAAIDCRTAPGNDGMDVSMGFQTLIPSVEHHQRCRIVALFGLDRFLQGGPSGMEQQVVDRLAIPQGQRRQLPRQREDHLKVAHPLQQQSFRRIDPTGAPGTGTLGTVAITARIVHDTVALTPLTPIPPPAQGRGTTQRQLGQRALHLRRGLLAVTLDVPRRGGAENLSDA